MTRSIVVSIFVLMFLKLEAQESSLLTLMMKNGDIVTGYSSLSVIPFATDYGNLTFPVSEIRKIELGVSSDGVDRHVLYSRLDKIRFGSLEESERAFDVLVEENERILPMIRDYINSPDYQSNIYNPFTVELLYQILLEKYSLSSDYSESDIIHFKEAYSIDGEFKFETLILESEYGEFVFNRNQIHSIEVNLKEEDLLTTKSFKLLADQHVLANRKDGWLKTGLLVKTGDRLNITSTGQVVLESLDGNTYTPDGGLNGSPPPPETGPHYGSVVFKIGEKGATEMCGNQYTQKMEETGILYLSIYESVYNSGNKGHYICKVKIEQL